MDAVTEGVGKHLHLDVAWRKQGALDQQVAVAKARERFGARALQGGAQLLGAVDQAHAAPATTRHSLDHERKADALGLSGEGFVALVGAEITGQDRHALLQGQRLGGGFSAQRVDGRRRRADPDQARVDHGLGEVGVFAQEAVAGVHRVCAAVAGGGDQLVDAQVAVGGGRAAQRHGGAGLAHMQCLAVGVGKHRHGGQPQPVGGADDAAGDFAAVGNEEFLQTWHAAHLPARCACHAI